jgi:hypothetical protein
MRKRQVSRSQRQEGSVLVIALLLMTLLSILGITLLTVASTEHSLAFNGVWSEEALMAAEAGVNRGINQLGANADTSIVKIDEVSLDAANQFKYRSGHKTPDTAAALGFVGARAESGYSISVGTGYNPSGYVFHQYQIIATGKGPNNAVREVEVQAEYGPIAQ